MKSEWVITVFNFNLSKSRWDIAHSPCIRKKYSGDGYVPVGKPFPSAGTCVTCHKVAPLELIKKRNFLNKLELLF